MDLIEKVKALYEQYHKADQKDPLSQYPNVQAALGLMSPSTLITHKIGNYLAQPSTESPESRGPASDPSLPPQEDKPWTGSAGVQPSDEAPRGMADSLASRSGDATMGAKPIQGMADSLAARSGDPMMQFPRPDDGMIVGPEEAVNLAAGQPKVHSKIPAPSPVQAAPQPEAPLVVPGSEIGSQDNLKAALEAQNQGIFHANLGKAAAQILAGFTHQKPPSTEFQDGLIKQAQDIPVQYKALVDNQKNDPTSKISQDYREALKQMGIKVSDASSASSLEKAAPFLTKHMENREAAKERAAQNDLQRQMHRENLEAQLDLKRELGQQANEAKAEKHAQQMEDKDNKRFDDMNKRISAEVASSRGAFGKGANIIRSADALEALAAGVDPNKLDTRQVYEMARGLDAMISQSGGTIGGTEHLIPKTIQGDASKIQAWITGNVTGANQASYVKSMLDTVRRERETAKQQIAKTQGKLLSSYSDLKEKNPEKWALVLRQNDLPEDVFDSSPKIQSKEPTPKLGGKIKVSNGTETLMIDESDLSHAQQDGYKQVK